MRLFWILIAVLLAAGVSALLVLPEQTRLKDLVGWEPSGDLPGVPLKDDSRVPGANGDAPEQAAAEGAAPGQPPSLQPILADQVPFETACGLFLTSPDSRDVIFMMPQAAGDQQSAVAALNIEGELVLVRRAEADGESFGGGAYPRQLFRNEDGTLTVVAQVGVDSPAQAGRVGIDSGELTVMMAGRPTLKMPVAGAAGC